MLRSTVVLCAVVLAGLVAGCSDDDSIDAVGEGGRVVVIDVGSYPSQINEFPMFISVGI